MSSWKTVNGQLRPKGLPMRPVSKPGKHGTLYLYRIVYWPDRDPCRTDEVTRIWAYSEESAIERFLESSAAEGYEDQTIRTVERVREPA